MGTFITVPSPLFAQYTLLASTATPSGEFCPTARIVVLAPLLDTIDTLPVPLLVQ